MTELLISCIRGFLPFIVYTFLTAGAALFFQRSFGSVLPVVMCWTALVLYVSQYLCSSFFPGFFLIMLLMAAGIALLIIEKAKGGGRLRYVLTPGITSFTLMFFLAGFFLFRKEFTNWDEFSHWGMMVKESLRLDRFYCIPESRLMWHKDYPPFTCLINVFWCSLSGFSEGKATMAMQMLTFSFMLPWLSEVLTETAEVCKKHKGCGLLVAATLELLFLMAEFSFDLMKQRLIHSILPDALLAFGFAYLCLSILLWERLEWFEIASLVIVSTALVMTKQSAMSFFMLFLFLLLLAIFRRSFCGNQSKIRNQIICFSATAAVPSLFFYSWMIYKGRYIANDDFSQQGGQFSLRRIDCRSYLNIILGRERGIGHDTFAQYCNALLDRNLSSIPWMPVTWCSAAVLCFAALLFLRRCSWNKVVREASVLLMPVFCVGTAGYAFMMSVLYLFCFPAGEQKELAGFARYMDSYVLGEVLILLVLLLIALSSRPERKLSPWILGILVLLLTGLNAPNIRHLIPQRFSPNYYSVYREYAEKLKKTVPADSSVFIVYDKERSTHPQWWGPLQLFVQYYDNEVDISDQFTRAYSADFSDETIRRQVKTAVESCDYLYVVHTCENFNCGMKEYHDGKDFIDNTIYKISTENGLEFLETME